MLQKVLPFLLAGLVLTGCASAPPPSDHSDHTDEIQVRGWSSESWSDGAERRPANLRFEYETSAWQGSGHGDPFHHMLTVLELAYDAETGEITNALVTSSEPGRALRHVCLTPAGPVLKIRMSTTLDYRHEDLTIVKLHEYAPSVHGCEDVGVGPNDGLVEVLEVVFSPDGTWEVRPGTGAHLTRAGVRVERSMTVDPEGTRTERADWR